MAIAEFFSVPEIDHTAAANHEVFARWIIAARSMDRAALEGKQLEENLAGKRPEELPPCFLAVQAEAISHRTGWATEYGRWEPNKELFLGRSCLESTPLDYCDRVWMRTTLLFRPKDGSKSDYTMTLYNLISCNNTGYFLEEDMALCHVFRASKGKGKGVVHSEESPPLVCIYAADPAHDLTKIDYPDIPMDAFFSSESDLSNFNVAQFLDLDAQGNVVGGLDLSSVDSSIGVPKKRPRTKPAGGSEAWQSFIRINTKDREVVYAACRHCGRMMKLKGGTKCGTKSLSRHNESCVRKPGSSMGTLGRSDGNSN